MAKVMIVEDDGDIRESLKDLLAEEGFEVLAAVNGQDALDQLRAAGGTLPGLILLDIMMPVMDGHAFRLIQMQDPMLSGIPVVVTSADPGMMARMKGTQVNGFLKKPADLDQILEMARKYAGR